tara:strand:+ start:164 stop:328 length:165 start_codon:yes stop_codon:yes gene_type:complete
MIKNAEDWLNAEWECYCSHQLMKTLSKNDADQLVCTAWCNNCAKTYKITLEDND